MWPKLLETNTDSWGDPFPFDASDIFVPTSNEAREQWIKEEEERRLEEPTR